MLPLHSRKFELSYRREAAGPRKKKDKNSKKKTEKREGVEEARERGTVHIGHPPNH